MKKTTIYLDIDGVLADYATAYLLACGSSVLPENLFSYRALLDVTETTFEGMLATQATAGFLNSIKLYGWAGELIKLLQRSGEVVLLTAVLDAERAAWAARMLPGIPLIQDNHKGRYAHKNAILVDDSIKNCEEFEAAGGCSVLFSQSWNAEDREFMRLERGKSGAFKLIA